jgi:MFS family permease
MPAGMAGLSIVLLVQEATGSYAAAGLVSGVYSVTIAAAAPLQGRLIDRLGQTRVLLPAAFLFGGAFAGLGIAAASGASLPLLYALAILAGLTWPALAACVRALWAGIVERGGPGVTLQTAYGFESTVQELIFIAGPFLVALMVRFASPMWAMLLGAALAVGGTVVFATTPTSRAWRPAPRTTARHWAGPLRSGGIRVLVVLGALFGSSIGALEVSIVAFASGEGDRGAAGFLLAIWSLGSMVGGLWFGTRHWSGAVHNRLLLLVWCVAICFLGPALVGSIPLMALALILTGLCIAPLLGTLYLLIDVLAPEGTVTESFTWMHTGFIAGIAAGVSIAGGLIELRGVHFSLGAAVVGAALSAAIGTLGRRALDAGGRQGDAAVARAA